ncbi:MAG: T9SS type A sorting domain-containing protein [Bacteroidota bacterium]|nr:T9SS type A sorting domain-containing protein [Bacteroidota bacterium]
MFDDYLDTSCFVPLRNFGISQIESSFSIYPNPFNNKLTLEGKPIQNCKAEVYDITGKLIETSIINGNEINFKTYYTGLVLVRIIDKQGAVIVVNY